MNALILAAGVSRRLYPHTYDKPKCLLEVNNKPIIHYQLDALKALNIKDIIIVVGYHREMLMENVRQNFPDMNFHFLINHHYFETNTAYSVLIAKNHINSDLFLMNADVVYPISLLSDVFSSEYKNVLAVDIKICGEEEVKVIDGGSNKVVAIGKDLIEDQCLGEFIGVAKLSKNFIIHFMDSLERLIKAGGKNDYFEAAIQAIINDVELNFLNVSQYPCLEIDFIEDLKIAERLFKGNQRFVQD
tara:strand:+ start:562 stop:1296 length:735 start_codon:yes stop_codon:yes gene_type:complete